MAQVRPFAGIHYAREKQLDASRLIAPPYDVLDESGKLALQAASPFNIVSIDLPQVPPTDAGADSVYEKADVTLRSWLAEGILKRDTRAALYPYMQTYEHGERTFHRRGLVALVKLAPFEAGDVVPHEKTHKGPIEDRLKLMRATGVQLSPVFGLYNDSRNEVTNLLYRNTGKPIVSGELDGVRNDLWAVTEADVVNKVTDLLRQRPVYIADGHHRYTTALQYQKEAQARAGVAALPPNDPANWCMFVLVGMQDPGLLILPTHRLVGGLEKFDIGTFRKAIAAHAEVTESPTGADQIAGFVQGLNTAAPRTFGLFDGATRKLYSVHIRNEDILQQWETGHSEAWRKLDVAIVQRYFIEEVLQPGFAAGREPLIGYTADPADVAPQVDGKRYQIALLLKPTPLHALEDLGHHGEVMPQKSTYFYPKLATGMMINPLR